MGAAMPQKTDLTEDDMTVREVFTDLVAEFARSGSVGSEGRSKRAANGGSSLLPFSVPSFSGNGDDDSYLSISAKPKVTKGFR